MPDFKIAVDAMGGDHAPEVEIEGAIQAAAQFGIPIVLVGQEDRIQPFLEKHDTASLHIEEDARVSEVHSELKAAFPSRSAPPCTVRANALHKPITLQKVFLEEA